MSLLVMLRHPVTEGAHPVLTCLSAEGAWEELKRVPTIRHAPIGSVSLPAGQIRIVLPWVEDSERLAELVEEIKRAGLSVQIRAILEED